MQVSPIDELFGQKINTDIPNDIEEDPKRSFRLMKSYRGEDR